MGNTFFVCYLNLVTFLARHIRCSSDSERIQREGCFIMPETLAKEKPLICETTMWNFCSAFWAVCADCKSERKWKLFYPKGLNNLYTYNLHFLSICSAMNKKDWANPPVCSAPNVVLIFSPCHPCASAWSLIKCKKAHSVSSQSLLICVYKITMIFTGFSTLSRPVSDFCGHDLENIWLAESFLTYNSYVFWPACSF